MTCKYNIYYILEALCGEGFVMARYLLYAIILVIDLWLVGRCQMSLFVVSTPLTMLLEHDGGIRPICCGVLFGGGWYPMLT